MTNLLMISILLISLGCKKENQSGFLVDIAPQDLQERKSVPDFILYDATGQKHSLSQYNGNVVFLNFWATWCPPCLEEFPLLDELNRRLKAYPFTMIAISVDENWETIQKFLSTLSSQPSFLILHDPQKRVANRYQTTKFPESYLIDPQQNLINKFMGPYNWVDPNYFFEIRSLF